MRLFKYLPLLLLIGFLPFQAITQEAVKDLTLVDVWASRTFFPERIHSLTPLKDGEHYCKMEEEGVVSYSYRSGKKGKTLVNFEDLKTKEGQQSIDVEEFMFSADETKVLLTTESEPIYRHSSKAFYYVWDIKNKKLLPLSDKGKQQLADFSPDGSKVAFTRDNNIFIKELATGKETQVTADGLYNHIIYGSTDWVYEEEFSFTKAFFWSPDGKKIAFYRFDESNVREFSMTMYGELYPEEYKYKYPKAGEDNSIVNIYVYNLDSKTTQEMDTGDETDIYYPRIKWTNDPEKLAIYRMNRLQNKLEILLADANSGKSEAIYTETNQYYIDINDDLTFLPDNTHFLLTSEKDGYNHVYKLSLDGKEETRLTSGKWDVIEVKGFDPKKGLVYYVSAATSPMDRDLYCVGLDGQGKKKLTPNKGFNGVSFSTGYKYFINTFSDANTPPVYTVYSTDGKLIKVLEKNENILSSMKEYGFSKKEFFSMNTASGVELNGWMIKPRNFDPSVKYPVFMYVYGGPGSQTVKNEWGYYDFIWHQLLAQKGYIVASVDNRGTGARGEEFKKCTYMQLGKLETIDQIDAAKYLGSLPYVDSSRIGIFGWSYGGYMSTLCMTKGADYFKMGIAVAPVTNWRYYDNIYTERFMRKPQDNASGYDDNSPINHVKLLKGKYLLIHGTADDNVHMQNSIELIDALIKANKQFDMFLYPNRNHGIYGGITRYHLYTKMTDFILENL